MKKSLLGLLVLGLFFALTGCDTNAISDIVRNPDGGIPSISISGGTSAVTDSALAFTATPSDLGGVTASYQWQVDGSNVGTDSDAYTFSQSTAGTYSVQCVMTVDGTDYSSNVISVTVSSAGSPALYAGDYRGTYSGNYDGDFEFTILSDGSISGYLDKGRGQDEAALTGTIDGGGNFTVTGTDGYGGGVTLSGTITSSSITGTFTYSADGSTMSLTGGIATGSAPDAPTGVQVSGGNSQLTVSWNGVSDANGYNIYYGIYSDGTGATQDNSSLITATSHTITGLDDDTLYYVWIEAVNDFGVSNFSSDSGRTEIGSLDTPDITRVSGQWTTLDNQFVNLYWDEIDGASEYEIYRSINRYGSYTKVGETSDVNFTDSGAELFIDYSDNVTPQQYYKIKAVVGSIESSYSEPYKVELPKIRFSYNVVSSGHDSYLNPVAQSFYGSSVLWHDYETNLNQRESVYMQMIPARTKIGFFRANTGPYDEDNIHRADTTVERTLYFNRTYNVSIKYSHRTGGSVTVS